MKHIILGINGSPVKNSQVNKSLGLVLAEAKKRGGTVKQIDLINYKIL